MRKRNGGYILLDFGLAIEGNTVVRSSRKKNGVPEYKSPEKWRNESHISTQSDIYSFGVILYTMLAGRPPFKLEAEKFGSFGAEQHLYEAHLNEAPPAIYTYRKEAFEAAHPGQTYEKDYPDWLEALILKCLEKKEEDRLQSGKALMVFVNEKELLRSARNYENLKEAFDAAHFGLTNGKEYLEWLEAFILKNLETRLNHQVYHDRLEAFILKCVKKEMDRLISDKNPVAIGQELDNSDGENDGVNPPVDKPFENGYEYVDLGLSVKWATCNVGASKPEDYGDYFAWGEKSPKSTYNWSTYKWCRGFYNEPTKYYYSRRYGIVNNKAQLELSDDAARANWGGAWRMPTHDELRELHTKCTWTWTTQNGVKGYKITSKINGRSIFLPAAGYRNGSSLYLAGSYGYYWSSSLDSGNSYGARCVHFNSSSVDWYGSRRGYGLSVRPVCP
jgi:serine/threonine protein kinase